jgi:hypothetical protein
MLLRDPSSLYNETRIQSIHSLLEMRCLLKSVRVIFLFVFPQIPSSINYHATLTTFYTPGRRIASCSK